MTRRFLVEVVALAWLGVRLRRVRCFDVGVCFSIFGVILSVDISFSVLCNLFKVMVQLDIL